MIKGVFEMRLNFEKVGVSGKSSKEKAARKNAESLRRVNEWKNRVKSHL